MRVDVSTEFDSLSWNAFAAWADGAHPFQSYEWGEFQARRGWRPIRVGVRGADGRLVAAAALLERPIGRLGKTVLYCPGGPVLRSWTPDAVRQLAAGLLELGRERSALMVRVEPTVSSPQVAALLLEAGFRAAAVAVPGSPLPRHTTAVDLVPCEQEILARMKPKWRYNVGLARRRGVSFATAGRDELPTLYHLIVQAEGGDRGLGYSFYADLWDLLSPAGMPKLFVALMAQEVAAAALCLAYGDTCWYLDGAVSAKHRPHMPGHLLQWGIMQWARNHGYHSYNLGPVAPDAEALASPIAGITRFRIGFGGARVTYPGPLDLPVAPVMYGLRARVGNGPRGLGPVGTWIR